MGERAAVDTSQGGRRIIERPRLTRLLTESESRVMLLVAPAGYGKTTLARQWLAERELPHVWYELTHSATDVAALGIGLAATAARVIPTAGQRLRAQLKAVADPGSDASLLAADLAAELESWPADTRFVIDDYQLVVGSEAAETFVEVLVQQTRIPFLIATRERPTWITAKKLLYGDVTELGRTALAMTHGEAAETLSKSLDDMPGLVSLAEGWPAVIGLAALLPTPLAHSQDDVPATLHEFFAEELYQGLDDTLKTSLALLSLAPAFDELTLRMVFGSETTSILDRGCRAGFLSRNSRRYEMHPLLRQFIRTKLVEVPSTEVRTTAHVLASAYAERKSWDNAIDIAEEFRFSDIILRVLHEALDHVLSEGRMATVERWLTLARDTAPTEPIVRLAEIEVAFRSGKVINARASARELARTIDDEDPIASRVYLRAGQIAHLDDRLGDAVNFFTAAEESACGPADQRRALWSRFVSLTDLDDRVRATAALSALQNLPPVGVDDLLRANQARLHAAIRWGALSEALEAAAASQELVERSDDPIVRTGFLQTLGVASIVAARYPEAHRLAEREIDEAVRYRLDWVHPHALELQSAAAVGLRDFRRALKLLARVVELAEGNPHTELNVEVLRARIHLCNGAPERAVSTLQQCDGASTSPGMHGDFLSTFGLALICAGRTQDGLERLDAAEAVTTHLEARTLSAFGRAIATLVDRGGRNPDLELLETACAVARETGNNDAFVTAYRACPALLGELNKVGERAAFIDLAVALDPGLAETFGLKPRSTAERSGATLTRREREVLSLVAQGLSNRQIARALWIAESTAKVHTHHVLEKLGVQSRTEAAALASDIL